MNCSTEGFQALLNEFWNLKKQKRSGWLLPKCGLPFESVESVADHSWGAAFLAELVLPETSNSLRAQFGEEPGLEAYCKSDVIRILIVHDLAEASTGDVPLPVKTDSDRESERTQMSRYVDMYSYFMNISEISIRWAEFDQHSSYNSCVAKDLDQLECFIQLFVYQRELIKLNGYQSWNMLVNEWRDNLHLTTQFGKQLGNLLRKNLFGEE